MNNPQAHACGPDCQRNSMMSLSVTIVYTVMTHVEGFPVRYLMPGNDNRPRWFPGPFSDPGEASQEFRATYGQECRYVSPQEFEGFVSTTHNQPYRPQGMEMK